MSRNSTGIAIVGGALAGLLGATGCALDGDSLDVDSEPFQPAQEDRIHGDLDPLAVNEAPAAWYGKDAFAIASGQTNIRNLTVGPDGLFWIADRGGTPVLHRSSLVGQSEPIHLAIDSSPIDAVVLGGVPIFELDGAVVRLTADGFEPEKLTTFDTIPVDLEVRGNDLFVATADGCVHTLTQGADEFVQLACSGSEPLALATSDAGVYWTATDGVMYTAEGGAAVQVAKPGTGGPIAADDEFVYWAEDTRVFSAPLAGGEPTVVTEAQGGVLSLVDDRFFVYYTSKDDGSVWQYDKTTGATRRLTQGWSYPTDLALAGSGRIYFADKLAGLVVTQNL